MATEAAASPYEDQQAFEEYNEEERGLQDDEEFEEAAEEEADAGQAPGTSKRRGGRPTDRMKAVLDRLLDQCYLTLGIVLESDLPEKDR